MSETLPFSVEYAKSGRARCQGCKEPIANTTLRLAKVVQSPFHDGSIVKWFHPDCFFTKQRPKSTADIANYDSIRWEDQQMIEKKIAIQLQKDRTSIEDPHDRDKVTTRSCPSGSEAEPKIRHVYSNLLAFLEPVTEIRPSSQCSNNSSQGDSAEEDESEFRKPRAPKKSSKKPKYEDAQDKLYEALTANLKQSNEAKNTILSENPDKLFLVSLADDFSAIKDEFKLEAKADMINLIRKYKNMGQPSPILSNQYGYQDGYKCEHEDVYQSEVQP